MVRVAAYSQQRLCCRRYIMRCVHWIGVCRTHDIGCTCSGRRISRAVLIVCGYCVVCPHAPWATFIHIGDLNDTHIDVTRIGGTLGAYAVRQLHVIYYVDSMGSATKHHGLLETVMGRGRYCHVWHVINNGRTKNTSRRFKPHNVVSQCISIRVVVAPDEVAFLGESWEDLRHKRWLCCKRHKHNIFIVLLYAMDMRDMVA